MMYGLAWICMQLSGLPVAECGVEWDLCIYDLRHGWHGIVQHRMKSDSMPLHHRVCSVVWCHGLACGMYLGRN